jgi:hypothetical protein
MAVHRRPKQKIDEDEEGALASLAVRASDVMALAGFETVMEFNPRRRRDVDFFAQKTDEFGNVRRIAITCALEANPFEQTEQHTTFNDDDEDWLVVGKVFSDNVRESPLRISAHLPSSLRLRNWKPQ